MNYCWSVREWGFCMIIAAIYMTGFTVTFDRVAEWLDWNSRYDHFVGSFVDKLAERGMRISIYIFLILSYFCRFAMVVFSSFFWPAVLPTWLVVSQVMKRCRGQGTVAISI